MSDFLARMAEASAERVREARRLETEPALLARALGHPRPPALELGAFDVIAELKLRSPAAGGLADDRFDLRAQVEAYARGGAAAVSVLTEPREFRGERAHLRAAAAALSPMACPVMRKDFLVDPYQVMEARADGASGVLVIVTMLGDEALGELIDCARDLELFVLLEAFDAEDLARVGRLADRAGQAELIAGVNCRNLKTLEVDFSRFAELAPYLPADLPTVAESGVGGPDDVAAVAALGYRLALVGSALMRAGDPSGAVAALVERGRATREARA